MKVYVFLANGFETVEALAPIDILRRGAVEVCTVSISDDKMVESKQGVKVCADMIYAEGEFGDGDMLFLPGGIPGTPNLEAHNGLAALIDKYYSDGKYLAAICAAPSILGHHEVLKGKRATCYPGFEEDLIGATTCADGVVVDGHIITGKGMGKSIEMGLAMLSVCKDAQTANSVKESIQF